MLLDDEGAAQRLGLSPGTLRNWRVRGVGPRFVKLGRAVKYDPADLNTWVDQHKVNSTSEPVKAA